LDNNTNKRINYCLNLEKYYEIFLKEWTGNKEFFDYGYNNYKVYLIGDYIK
jgi:hypothetical protein